MNKKDFIRLLADEAGFTISDTRYFMAALISLFAKAIENGEELNIRGLGKLTYRVLPERKGYNPYLSQYDDFEESKMPMFRLAFSLSDLARSVTQKVCKSSQKYKEDLEDFVENGKNE